MEQGTANARPLYSSLLTLIVVFSQPTRLPVTDATARAALRRAVIRLEKTEISQKQFEGLVPLTNVSTWRRLQRATPSTQSGWADLAFVLAYYGVDYLANLARLLAPYRRWRRASFRPNAPSNSHDAVVVESLPTDLALLYRKHHDELSLGYLLDLKLDGAYAEEQAGILSDLWPGHEVSILRVASGSSVRLGNVAEMLAGEDDDLAQGKATLAEIGKYTHHHDKRVAQAAKKVRFLIEAVYSLYSKP